MVLENDLLRITLDPSSGVSIRAFFHKPSNLELIGSSATDEAPAGVLAQFHDRKFDATATVRDDAGCAVALVGTSGDAPLKITQTFALKKGEAVLRVVESIENIGAHEREILWGERLAFGLPFLDANCRIDAHAVSYFDAKEEPILRMRWPKLADGTDLADTRAQPGETRRYYLADFAEGFCRVINAPRGMCVELCWDAALFPYCWLEERAGRLSLAPFTGLPDAVESGHGTIAISAGQSVTTKFEIRVAAVQ